MYISIIIVQTWNIFLENLIIIEIFKYSWRFSLDV